MPQRPPVLTGARWSALLVLLLALVLVPAASATQALVVPRGETVRLAFASDLTGFAAPFAPSFGRAVQMAVEAHPAIRGFPVQIDVVDAPCGDAAAAFAAANLIVSDPRHVAVLGHICSEGFAAALPVYEAAGVVVVSGTATRPDLPMFAPTVFNRTAVDDDAGFTDWYAAVSATPANLAWRDAYAARFGESAGIFADLYYDAALVVLRTLQRTSSLDRGDLVVDRAALAEGVRAARINGATCEITFAANGDRVNDPDALARCANPTD